jgi:hypothetical protein
MSSQRFCTKLLLTAIFTCLMLNSAAATESVAGTLGVVILPEALVTIPSSITGVVETAVDPKVGWIARFDLPVSVKIRLPKDVAAELLIEPVADLAEALADYSGQLFVDGTAAPFVPGVPAKVPINASGVRQIYGEITLRGDGVPSPVPIPVRLRLRSADGAISLTSTVLLTLNNISQ